MKDTSSILRPHERWAHFRFSVIGPLLAAPPPRGQLQAQLEELAAKKSPPPISEEWVLFGLSTIERWYYKALRSKAGPIEVLKRKIRSDHGQHPSLHPGLIPLLTEQHRQHPSWSYQLHFDNLTVVVEQQPRASPMPSYVSLLRYMKSHGLFKRPRRGPVHSPGAQAAEQRCKEPGDPQLRKRICQRTLAFGFSSRLLARAADQRPMGVSDPAGDTR